MRDVARSSPTGTCVSHRFTHRRGALAALASLLLAAPLPGQILKVPRRSAEPGSFLALGIGMRQQQSVSDGRTRSTWDFGQGVEYRAALERHVRNGTSAGIAYGQARMPLVYSTTLSREDAHARVRTLMLTLHGGAPRGLHQVFDLSGGVTRYSDFTRDRDGAAVAGAPARDDDVTFALGYGLGYAFSPRSAVTLVQEYGLVIHQSEGLSGNTSRSQQAYTTRVTVRMGLGSKRR